MNHAERDGRRRPNASYHYFEPNFYDLLLIDISMPYIDGFQFSERILEIDINVKNCSPAFPDSDEPGVDGVCSESKSD